MKYLINDIYDASLNYNWIISTYNKQDTDRLYIAIDANYVRENPEFFQGYSIQKTFNDYYSLRYLFNVYVFDPTQEDMLFILSIDLHKSDADIYTSTIHEYNQNKASYINCKCFNDIDVIELFKQVNSQCIFKVFKKFNTSTTNTIVI